MNLNDLAQLMGKSRREVEHMLRSSDIIELKLTEKKSTETKENLRIEAL